MIGCNRKIKVFASGVLGIRLHPKFNRLYVQCVNDPIIYVIETMTALVIQTIQLSSDAQSLPLSAHDRKTFTISPCGFLIFANTSGHDRIECFKISTGEKVAEYLTPIPIAARSFKITSVKYHPNMNVMVYTIFGDSIEANMFVLYHDNGKDGVNVEQKHTLRNVGEHMMKNEAERSFFDALYAMPSISSACVSDALISILEQIDDLFMVATPSPRQNGDFDRLNDMQRTLQRLQVSADQCRLTENQALDPSNHAIELKSPDSDASGRSNATHTLTPTHKGCETQEIRTNAFDTSDTVQRINGSSNSSQHTYILEKTAPLQVQRTTDQQSDPDKNNTYSISSGSDDERDLSAKFND